MCGIAGIIAGSSASDVTVPLQTLTDLLSHRGPDGSGYRYFRNRSVGFGHRRLSIVDLETGAQPMGNEDGRVWVTFNGEIYNHLVLRGELERLGHRFRTRADTEVMVHGWEEWGPGLLSRLNGIFAFALYDGRQEPGTVWLARDPAGVKPLYLGRNATEWWFASEVRAARIAGLVPEDLSREALGQYLVYRFIPAPATPFRGVWKVPAGKMCALSLAALPRDPDFRHYGSVFDPVALPGSAGEWEEVVRDGLRAAVGRQLMSDVPVGSLLSGGIDSTVVTRLMRDHLGRPPQAFAVGFTEDSNGGELALARVAAEALGVPLREVPVREADYQADWSRHFAGFGEPVGNSSVLLVHVLCRVVRESHKVVLSGQGADEPLGGYPRHAAERWCRLARACGPLLNLLPDSLASRDNLARMRWVAREADEARRFAAVLAVFHPEAAARMTGSEPEALIDPVRAVLPAAEDEDSLNRLLRTDTRLSLADDLLLVADQMSMAASVELRVPFLDLELLGLIERMPSRYKISWLGERKWLYRRAVGPLLPGTVRPALTGWRGRTGRKLGFATPIDRWFPAWVQAKGRSFLLGEQARLPHWIQPEAIATLLDDVTMRGRPRTRQVLALYALESWLRWGPAQDRWDEADAA